jgi:Flp pilus assembly protein TadG
VRPTSDEGAAVAEFTMVAALLVALLLAVLQVAVYLYERNIVAASAAAGSRYAASLGVDPASGAQRAEELLSTGLSRAATADVTCRGYRSTDAATGLALVTVSCTGHAKVLFSAVGLPVRIDVTASSLQEQDP